MKSFEYIMHGQLFTHEGNTYVKTIGLFGNTISINLQSKKKKKFTKECMVELLKNT
jgi:ribosomal protein L2